MKAIFTVDVEDWFHILEVPATPQVSRWDSLPSHVERNFRRLLDIFSEANVQTTCFFLGWVGEKFPHLVREASARGHEIASHGYAHTVVDRMTAADFYADISTAKQILEDAAGEQVYGYRAAGFSASARTPWLFSEIARAGYTYDTSVFPAYCEHGGIPKSPHQPYVIETDHGKLVEFPVTTAKVFGRHVCLFGGGHLRLAPLALIRWKMREVAKEGRPVICYVHPREIDPSHPRLPMSPRRRFKAYVNLGTTEKKIRYLLSHFEFTSFQEFLAESQLGTPGAAAAATECGISGLARDN